MNRLTEQSVNCPYCGELIQVLIEYMDDDQQYIEDCQVCCRPINFSIWQDFNGEFKLQVSHENE